MVAAKLIRLHADGTLVREKPLSVLSNDHNYQDDLKKIALVGIDGNDGKLQGYVYDVQVLPTSASTKDHFIKNPPVKLTLDGSCISDGVEVLKKVVMVSGALLVARLFTAEDPIDREMRFC